MALNKYFNNVPKTLTGEQSFYESLVNEAIQIRGHNVYYILRESLDEVDYILGEDPVKVFKTVYTIPMFSQNVEEFHGDQDYLSKFGLEIRDHIKFLVAGREFEKTVPANVITRPREGDLIYSPLYNKMFEITFLKNDPIFYALGRRAVDRAYFYELSCEAFKYSHEKITTGIPEIDDITKKKGYIIELYVNVGANTQNYSIGEEVYQGSSYATATASGTVVDWNRNTGLIKLAQIKGLFGVGNTVVGLASNTNYYISGFDPITTSPRENISDNILFEQESNTTIDSTETNPFWSA